MKGLVFLLLITTVHCFLSVPTAQKLQKRVVYQHQPIRHEKAKGPKYGTQARPMSFHNVVFEGLTKYLSTKRSFQARRIKPIICTYAMAIPGTK
mgnify:FL=1